MWILWEMTKRRVKAYNGLKNYKILVPNWLFFPPRKQQRSNQKYVHGFVCHRKSSTFQRRAWCGFSLWYGSLLQLYKKKKTYDTEIMLLITGTRRLCREHTKLCILYFCSAVDIKGILKTKSAAGQQCFCFCVCFCSATSFRDHELPILFAVRAILNHHRLSTYNVPTAVIWDLSRSSMCFAYTRIWRWCWTASRVMEREGDLPQRAGKGECRDEWTDGVEDRPRYAYTGQACQCECDYSYYYRSHDEMVQSADVECSHPHCESECVVVMISWGFNALKGLVIIL